ncbi:MAG: hypothetical protein NT144_12495 [Bacteroidia bacterium]|nr:hypothetical protein [Bacteroidia bacterium]
MKKIFTISAALLLAATLCGQAPSSFKYQAVLRDARGNIKASTATNIIIGILQGSTTGTTVYSETHSTTTDGYGLINLEIGKGTVTNGTFAGINWGTGTYFVKVTVDGVEMGTSQLLSVPYALYASKAGNSFSGNYLDLTNKPTITNGTVTSITGTAPVSVATGTTTPVISMVQANGTTNGYLSSTDWTTFNNKSSFDGTWTGLTGKPNFTKLDKDSTDNVIITGNQTIAGNKTFTGITTVATPVNANDAATKAYVDALKSQVEELQFLAGTNVKDIDGNVYNTVTIGTQVWMKENLKTTKLNDGTTIPNISDYATFITLNTPAFCWYDNNISNRDTYGSLYNWYSVATMKLCPIGWHVPSDSEWKTLEMYLGMTQVQSDAEGWRGTDQGTQLKSTTGWNSGGNGSNTSGFTALPGGGLYAASAGSIGNLGYWRSSTNRIYRVLYFSHNQVNRYWDGEESGESVRCVKD